MKIAFKNILLLSAVIISGTLKIASAQTGNAKYVNPFIGTSGFGHAYPGATVPFGMVQLSPETGNFKWDYTSGYQYADTVIWGFAHTHLSGTGVSDLGDVLFFPFQGSKTEYRAAFSKQTEKASPGYYSVVLKDDDIKAELTAASKTGMHQYTFNKGGKSSILVDAQSGLVNSAKEMAAHVLEGNMNVESNTTVSGYIQTKKWVTKRTYFAIVFNRPFQNSHYLDPDKKRRLILDFDLNKGDVVGAKVALSTVSIEGAKLNLKEVQTKSFATVKADAEAFWDKYLSVAQITGSKAQKENFYTSLYHLLIQPNNIADADGKYRGADDKVNQSTGAYYSTLSLWDTFRAAHPLYTILFPERNGEIVSSMLAHFQAAGTLPVWTLMGKENYCMIGNHSIPVIVDAYLKGTKGIDAEKAYQAIKTTLTSNGNYKHDWKQYDQYGYYPSDLTKVESVSRTLEAGFDDWCAAQMAQKFGKKDDYAFFIKRSNFYKNLFDKSVNLMRGKNSDGKWVTPFDPLKVSHASTSGGDYTEGNAWQYSFHVLQDIPGLINIMGGNTKFVAKLDSLFTMDSKVFGDGALVDVTGLIGQYAHGNEPSHHIAYLYAMAGKPWKTQQIIPEILAEQYKNKPDGLSGNDDCGQMSAWYIFSSLGFYPVNPADGKYIFGTPAYANASLKVGNKTLTIEAKNLSAKNRFVKSITLNNKPVTSGYLTHQQIVAGGKLIFNMSPNHL
jgi:predicted alpha-1,2-mannosidase